MLDNKRGVTDIYVPAKVIAKAKYPSSMTIQVTSVITPWPCSFIFAHL